ncbi:hypothetical protein LCGC14_0283480 [marine sediment metagenome]|jgi:hypothetical protein|uniref:Uncharacterized protein n=2 Tax=root TaxID=1 RepID=A0A7V1FNV9_9RHOB|nr:hypothetical protein [Sulfitobacter litoralis]HDZ53133.1 hypothetical protein [Sulfitobacter litoralis]|tara:strand:+ start:1451 stop:1825 length:375 start_codon:yes stop_codon:yes gene_type:complete
MLDQKDLDNKAQELQRGLQDKLGVQGRDVSHALARAGRRLPARVQRQGKVFAQAVFMSRNPKVARQLDGATTQAAYAEVMTHIEGIDVVERRKDRLLHLAASVAFNLLFVTVAFITFLWWRGYI